MRIHFNDEEPTKINKQILFQVKDETFFRLGKYENNNFVDLNNFFLLKEIICWYYCPDIIKDKKETFDYHLKEIGKIGKKFISDKLTNIMTKSEGN